MTTDQGHLINKNSKNAFMISELDWEKNYSFSILRCSIEMEVEK